MAKRAAPLKAHSQQARDACDLAECSLGDRRKPLWAPGKVKAVVGVSHYLNPLGWGCQLDSARTNRFRPMSNPGRSLAGRWAAVPPAP
jgi:hypothetical protein